MINFSTLQGLTIQEGVVTQIADASGRVLWGSGKPIILEVEKITSNTYAGETLYENEEFILLDIYPKTNGTVKVTYGGLTKTITDTSGAEEPNAQQVYFGTFNGASDSVATPANGTLTIEGGYYAFGSGTYTIIPNKTNSAYCGCVTSVIEWGSLKVFAPGIFSNCTNITSIQIPDGITDIPNDAFSTCTSLTSIVIPNSVTSIGYDAFYDCSSLESIIIGNSVTNIGANAFSYCSSLTSIIIPNSVISIGDNIFFGCISLESIIIGNSVTSIGTNAFRVCISLTSITIPNSVISIGDWAFAGCSSLTSVVIGNSVTSISKYAFSSCTSLKNIVIPNSVTFIGIYAFNCYQQKNDIGLSLNHTNVKMLGAIPPEFEQDPNADAFGDTLYILMGTITVSKGCGEIYKNAPGWSRRAEQIVEAS